MLPLASAVIAQANERLKQLNGIHNISTKKNLNVRTNSTDIIHVNKCQVCKNQYYKDKRFHHIRSLFPCTHHLNHDL